jgi:hypothetical protein
MSERGVHVERARERLSLHGHVKLGIELALPLGTPDHRLVLGEPLGEPSRHVVLRQLDREDVPELVPEDVPPIERLALRAHGRDDVAEADPLDADVRKAARADAEVLAVEVELDGNGGGRREHVVHLHRAPCLSEHARHVALEDGLLAFGVADLEDALLLARIGLRDPPPVQHLERVVDADVEVVALPGLLERLHAFRLVAGAGLREPELRPGLAVPRIERHGVLHHRDDVVVAVLPVGELGDRGVRVAVFLVPREHLALGGLEAGLVVREEARRRAQAEELELARVDREPRVDRGVRRREVHVAERDPGPHRVGAGVLRVHRERFLRELLGGVEVERFLQLDPREHHARVGAMGRKLQHLGEHLLRVARVVLVDVQIRTPEKGLDPRAPVSRPAGRRDLCALALVIGGVRVLRVPQEVHRAPHHGEPLGVARRDRVAPVFVRELEQDRLRLRASPGPDQELPQLEPDPPAPDTHAGRTGKQQLDRVVDLPRSGEDRAPERERHEAEVRTGARLRQRRVAVRVNQAPLFEEDSRQRHERRGPIGTLDGQQRLFRSRIVRGRSCLERRGKGTLRGATRNRRRSRLGACG